MREHILALISQIATETQIISMVLAEMQTHLDDKWCNNNDKRFITENAERIVAAANGIKQLCQKVDNHDSR